MPKSAKKPSVKSFNATLERLPSALKWVIIRIPVNVEKVWGVRGQLKVKGDIDGFAFRSSLFVLRGGRHFLLVNKRMQKAARVAPGMSASFHLQPDTDERSLITPPELKILLAGDRSLRAWVEKLNYSIRKYIFDQIAQVKSAESRQRRAEQTAEFLLAAMDGERELPPILRAAFAYNARAYEGWQIMTPLQRRSHLMGIFYYRNPDTRAKRVAKAIQQATEIAEKKSKTRRDN
jgi:uncharacterized protein YdeI (YjbR/CyaY-like superfamily)